MINHGFHGWHGLNSPREEKNHEGHEDHEVFLIFRGQGQFYEDGGHGAGYFLSGPGLLDCGRW